MTLKGFKHVTIKTHTVDYILWQLLFVYLYMTKFNYLLASD